MVKERKMKAINFLQWFDLHYGINGMGRTMEGVQTVTLKMQMVADFYSQPFKPEMITELFEGWHRVLESKTRIHYANDITGIRFDYFIHPLDTPKESLMSYSMKGQRYKITDNMTLNDFISDCLWKRIKGRYPNVP